MKTDLKIYLSSQFISILGSELTMFALPIWVYQKTHSNIYLSMMSFFVIMPRIFLGPYAGAVADSFSPKKIVFLSDFLQAFGSFIILILVTLDMPNIYLLSLAALMDGLGETFQFPATTKILPKFVDQNELMKVNSYSTSLERSCQFLSPLLAGALLGWAGFKFILILDIISYVVGYVMCRLAIRGLSFHSDQKLKQLNIWQKSVDGLKLIWLEKDLRILLFLSGLTNFCFSLTFTYMAPYLLQLGVKESNIGIIFSIATVGQILGSLFISKIAEPKDLFTSEIWGTIFMGLFGLLVVGLAHGPVQVLIGYFITMSVLPFLNIWNRTNWYKRTPEQIQGRVFASRRSISSALGGLSLIFGGALLDKILIPALHSSVKGYQAIYISTGLGLSILCLAFYFIRKRSA